MDDVTNIKTPTLLLDAVRVQGNTKRVSQIATTNKVRLRPHIKTHKCVEIARIATTGQNGAITTSTLAEVHSFAKHGFDDFTYAVPIEPGKFAEVIDIVRKGVRLNLITDDVDIPPLLDQVCRRAGVKSSVFLKVDCGYHRCGVDPVSIAAIAIRSSGFRMAACNSSST